MDTLPKIGTMIRCMGPKFEAGAVTFAGQSRIDLPRRTEDGRIIPNTFDLYQLRQVGTEWIYQLVERHNP